MEGVGVSGNGRMKLVAVVVTGHVGLRRTQVEAHLNRPPAGSVRATYHGTEGDILAKQIKPR